MKRRIGSSAGGSFQSSVVKRIQITKVLSTSKFLTTVFDRSSSRFESSSEYACSGGSFHVVNTNITPVQMNSTARRFQLSGKMFVLTQLMHGLDVRNLGPFSFMRLVGQEWVYDVSSIEIRINETNGDITALSSVSMDGVFLGIIVYR